MSDVALAGGLTGAATVAVGPGVPASAVLIGLATIAFAVVAAGQTFGTQVETGRRWPSKAGWRLILWIAVPVMSLIVFGFGIEVASGGDWLTQALAETVSVGLAAVPAVIRPPPRALMLAAAMAMGIVLARLLVLLGAPPVPAALLGVEAALLVGTLAVSLLDRKEADRTPRPVQDIFGLVAGGVGVASVAGGTVILSALLAT